MRKPFAIIKESTQSRNRMILSALALVSSHILTGCGADSADLQETLNETTIIVTNNDDISPDDAIDTADPTETTDPTDPTETTTPTNPTTPTTPTNPTSPTSPTNPTNPTTPTTPTNPTNPTQPKVNGLCKTPDDLKSTEDTLGGVIVYRIRSSTLLCSDKTYTRPFSIAADNVIIDCDNAQIFLRNVNKRAAISSFDNKNIVIQNCRIDGERISITDSFANGEINGGPTQFTVDNVSIKNGPGVGMFIRATQSIIKNSTIANNAGVGIYLEYDTNTMDIYNNNVNGNGYGAKREGIAIDASYNNKVYNNTIYNNFSHGITLYRNCGEHGKAARLHSSHSNSIYGNTIYGHRREARLETWGSDGYNSSTIRPATAIAVALRQGKTLHTQQEWHRKSGEDQAKGFITDNDTCNNQGTAYTPVSWQDKIPLKSAVNSPVNAIQGGRMSKGTNFVWFTSTTSNSISMPRTYADESAHFNFDYAPNTSPFKVKK